MIGVWTPFINKKKRSVAFYLERMKKIAESKGGELVSTNCDGVNSLLKFKDSNNNLFEEQYFKVGKGVWSPFESKITAKKQKAINDFKDIVQKKMGKSLFKDENYINNRTKLEIESKEGVRFYRSLDELKRGCWLKFNNKIKKASKAIDGKKYNEEEP